ncbi:hypothetical protein Tco_0784916 [Tanacetum coccineum]
MLHLQPCLWAAYSPPLHHSGDKGQSLGETSLSFALLNVHSRAEGAKKHVVALCQLIMEIVSNPLSSQTWVGKTSTSAAPLSIEDFDEVDMDEALGGLFMAPFPSDLQLRNGPPTGSSLPPSLEFTSKASSFFGRSNLLLPQSVGMLFRWDTTGFSAFVTENGVSLYLILSLCGVRTIGRVRVLLSCRFLLSSNLAFIPATKNFLFAISNQAVCFGASESKALYDT